MFLLIDKPKGITSHDVIDRVRKVTGIRRTGHAGTLDPNATGLLIVGVGRESTKELWTKFGKLDKTYVAEIMLGEERETDDIEGVSSIRYQVSSIEAFTKSKIDTVLRSFVGEQMQIPPDYSAVKIKGKPAYKIARERFWTRRVPCGNPSSQNDSLPVSNNIKLEPRKVTIHSIKLLDYEYPIIKIETRVSSGTYIRAIARDLGRKLGCGAYLSELRRTKIGKYKVEDSVSLDNLSDKFLISKYSKCSK